MYNKFLSEVYKALKFEGFSSNSFHENEYDKNQIQDESMTFYNHIESARYEMFKLVDAWTYEGAETKARISQSLDQARKEYVRMESENTKLRELVLKNLYIALSEREVLRVHGVNPDGGTYIAAIDSEIATAKDHIRELGIEVKE